MIRRATSFLSVVLLTLPLMACDQGSLVTGAVPEVGANSTVDSDYEDADNNGFPDEGEIVTGAYQSYLAYEGTFIGDGDWYWDLGDGRILGTVDDPSLLDESVLTECDYQIQYRGDFENDPSLDSGWIKNEIACTGFTGTLTRNLTIIHETDYRYTGERPPAFGGEWEYLVDAQLGHGNVINPRTPK